ncbi:MAG: DUF1634 domain-containing protein [Chloroflexi bacterium]|nr:DUF1634 domain-containing protein [Chloroflexota bacterium]
MSRPKPGSAPELESAISYLLITGVAISLVLELLGGAVFYLTYGHLRVSREAGMFIQGRDFFYFLYQLAAGKLEASPALLLMISGIMVLVLTPLLRVALSVIYFARARDAKYVLFTLFVLAVLLASLALH